MLIQLQTVCCQNIIKLNWQTDTLMMVDFQKYKSSFKAVKLKILCMETVRILL